MNKMFLDFAIILSGGIGYFMSISLLTSPFFKSRANKYFSISLFLLTTITLLGWYDAQSNIIELFQTVMWEFLVPVTLFGYFLIQIGHKYIEASWYKWLYTPFLITLFIDVFLFLDFEFSYYDSSFNEQSNMIQLFYSLEDILSLVFNLTLAIWTRQLVKRADILTKEKRKWLLRLNLFIICIIILWLFSDIDDSWFGSGYYTTFLWILLSFLSWWVLYYGVFKLQIVTQYDEIHSYLLSKKKSKPHIQRSEALNSKVITQLYKLMEDDELYKNPLLSRSDLAQQLGISEGNLSQIINQKINKSVIRFVNGYRIKAAKELLHNSTFNKYAIEAIGMEAGFKSKSTFYSTFKNATGMSPGAFRKLQKS